jgi:hypothetical protein
MTTATDMLAKATTAYETALNGFLIRTDNRELRNFEIDKLRAEMIFWESRVAAENGRGYKPFRIVL